ncbi:MAG: ribonucleotide-triphosphate reductase, partial [Thermoprotei archaeon]
MAQGEVTLRAWDSAIKALERSYLSRLDWEVKENANTNFSYSNFRNFLFEKLVKRPEVLREFIPSRAVEAHFRGDMHIHKLPNSLWIPYCCGWSLERILRKGLRTPGVVSRPAKHFDTAVAHITNFFFIAAQEWTGAIAASAFDLYTAPFIRHDGLSYEKVKQVLQGMLFELNYPARAGYQCLSEDTKILTPGGWKSYKDLREGDLIYTFNLQTKKIELKPVRKIFVYKYKDKMYSLRNRTQKQLVSPNHRVVWVDFNDHDKVRYTRIEELLEYKSPIPVPTTAYPDFDEEDYPISDEELKLTAWFLAEGSVDTSGRTFRVTIYQSEKANPDKYAEILELLNKLGMKYNIHTITTGFSPTRAIKLNAESSKRILKLIGVKAKKPPKWLYRLSRRQARLFIKTYVKGDGWIESRPERIRIVTTDEELRDALVAVAVLAGYNVSFTEVTPRSDIGRKKQYQITLTSTRTDYIQRIEEVDYEGVIWSVNTENETVIAMREG